MGVLIMFIGGITILATYWPKYSNDGRRIDDGFCKIYEKINSFIKEIEEDTHLAG